METIKLYDKDAYQRVFTATVVSCEAKENGYAVILNQTLFFPEEGGQSPDQGVLGGAKVLDVQIKNEVITHLLDQPLEVGAEVTGEINWQHRFSNMQQHSGEHIFSGLVYSTYGLTNVGFHLSDQICTMDFSGPMTGEQIERLEWEVNKVISLNVPIVAGYPNKEELSALEYRSKKELSGAVRIVEVQGVDLCACCAPHVSRTGEIGGFRVQNVQNYKGGVRISYLCGFRALEAERTKNQVLAELTEVFTTSQDNLAESARKAKARAQELQYQLNQAKQALLELKIQGIPEGQKNVILFETDLEDTVMRNAINRLVEQRSGICAIFVGDKEKGYRFVIGSKNQDCRQVATLLREKLSARGGGSAAMIQGSVVATEEQIREVLK